MSLPLRDFNYPRNYSGSEFASSKGDVCVALTHFDLALESSINAANYGH